jgi:MoaA/NifB/PqqE/SkfB family radical SAM enzyme
MVVDIAKLEENLKSQFDVKLFCDLGELSASHNGLFKALSAVYQPVYGQNDRIVFYTSQDLTENLLRYLYETCNFLDISNWFVMLCCAKDFQGQIEICCEKYSQDPIPFQHSIVDIRGTKDIKDNFDLPDTVCAIPWHNIEIQQNGNLTPCCTSTDVLGNIKDITLDQAFYGEKMQRLRDDLLSGSRPEGCNQCWKVEDKKLTSIRMHNTKRLKKSFLADYIDRPRLANLDLKFNNTCNFKCRICSSESSSLFAMEQHKYANKPLIVQNNWGEDQNFIDQVIDHLPDIKNIDMYGGEPFLIKKFQKVLKLAVEKNYARNIRLHYNSNGSIWPEDLIPLWSSFQLVDIHFSIDAIGKRFELQRGGDWKKVEDNILGIKNLGLPNLTISIMPTISVMNLYYIDEVYNWATKHQFPIFVGHVKGESLELHNLTKESKKLIVDKFADHPWAEIQNIIKIIKMLPDSDGIAFRKRMQWFDHVRQENFTADHPEIATAMGYSKL